jgi:hypothetical protein
MESDHIITLVLLTLAMVAAILFAVAYWARGERIEELEEEVGKHVGRNYQLSERLRQERLTNRELHTHVEAMSRPGRIPERRTA